MNPTVAFLDSGIGGIPYLKYFLAQRQDIPTRYIADTRNFPYGLKTEAQLRRNLEVLVREQVLPYGIQMIAIVCNTASVAGLEFLRQRFPELHFIGTVPAIKPAAQVTKSGNIGILATERTIGDPYLDGLISKWAPGLRVHKRALPRLVEYVEGRNFGKPEVFSEIVGGVVSDFRGAGVDTVVLACTHFLYVSRLLEAAFEGSVRIVDSRSGVTRQILRVWDEVIGAASGAGERVKAEARGKDHPDHTRVSTGGEPESYFSGLELLLEEPAGSGQ